MTERRNDPRTRRPSLQEFEEVIEIDANPDQLARAVLAGGGARREPADDQAPGPKSTLPCPVVGYCLGRPPS